MCGESSFHISQSGGSSLEKTEYKLGLYTEQWELTKAAEIKKREPGTQTLSLHDSLWKKPVTLDSGQKRYTNRCYVLRLFQHTQWRKTGINILMWLSHRDTHTHRGKLPSLNPSRSHIYTASIERNDFEDLRHRWARPCEDWFFIHSFGPFFSRNNNRVSFCGFVFFQFFFHDLIILYVHVCVSPLCFLPVTTAEMWAVY